MNDPKRAAYAALIQTPEYKRRQLIDNAVALSLNRFNAEMMALNLTAAECETIAENLPRVAANAAADLKRHAEMMERRAAQMPPPNN